MPHFPILPIAISTLANASTASHQTKMLAHRLLAQHKAMVLTYNDDYDIVKYNFIAPVTDSQFEYNNFKWQFIELAKVVINSQTLSGDQFSAFLNVMYGEGYREPKMSDISWFADIQQKGPLLDIFFSHLQEEKDRYQILETSLVKMRFNHKLKTLNDFKEFISPIVIPKSNMVEPPMWNTIGYSPVQRGNRTYTLSIQSFFLVDSVLHLLDNWDDKMQGEPEWDSHVKRLRAYRKIYSHMFPINSMLVRQAINSTMKFPKN